MYTDMWIESTLTSKPYQNLLAKCEWKVSILKGILINYLYY